MQIKETLGVSKEAVLKKEYDLWIAYSFGNKWFTQKNVAQLINFGVKHCKQSLLICIPSRLYATNLRYIENLRRSESLKRAFDIGDEKSLEIENIKKTLNEEDRSKIIVAQYDEIFTSQYVKQREVLFREFSQQDYFYNKVMEISNEILKLRNRTDSKERSEAASLYVIQELPLFLAGVRKIDSDITHTVVLYPGLGKIDDLVMSIKNDNIFKILKEKLCIQNEIGIVSVE